MFRARSSTWVGFSTRFKVHEIRNFCNRSEKNSGSSKSDGKMESSVSQYNETYKQLQNLDFMTATKILFSESPKKKKFGLDFHLVQLFFACMPSLAVYLVAQYARYEMRKMDAQLEEKKKKEEEEKEKAKEEEERKAAEEKETESHPELAEVKVRLEKLEETVKEIFVEAKKQSGGTVSKTQEDSDSAERKQVAGTEPNEPEDKPESGKEHQPGKQKDIEKTPGLNQGKASSSLPVSNDQQGKTQNGRNQEAR